MLNIIEIKEDVRRAKDMGDRDAMNRVLRFHFPLLFNALRSKDQKIQNLEEHILELEELLDPPQYDGPDLDDWAERGPDDFGTEDDDYHEQATLEWLTEQKEAGESWEEE
jgi:hypothetical protein